MSPLTRIRRVVVPALAVALCASLALAQQEVPTRDQIPEQYTWDLSTIYPGLQAWEQDFDQAEQMVTRLAKMKSDGIHSADELLDLLRLHHDVYYLIDKLVVYAHQLSDTDTRDEKAIALKNRVDDLATAMGEASAWIVPTLQSISEQKIKDWTRGHHELGTYSHYLADILRRKMHTLSPREEELLAMAGNLAASPSKTYQTLKYAEMDWHSIEDENGERVVLSPARYGKFIRSDDGRLRRDAFMGTMATLAQHEKTFATTLAGAIHGAEYFAKARGFDNALHANLFDDNLPPAVYTNLVETVNENLPLLHRWAALRKKAMGVDELHVYDLYQPLATAAEQEIAYDDAVRMVIAALEPLGPEYCEPMKLGFASRWIDVYETQGKRPGGYSWGSYDTNPFILLNYNKTPREMSVIAHEMGHSMHSYFSHKHQPKVYGEYSYFVAEVAAIFNEILLEDHRLKQADTPQQKLALLNQQIDNLRGTVFRQVMFAEFEHGAHQMALRGEPLTAESLGQLYMDIFHTYWGPDVVRDEEHAVYWSRIPHFYRNYYVYRYATSYCAAVALAQGVLNREMGALNDYLGFLKAGSSDYPLNILKRAGVDMTTRAPVQATMRRFERLVSEMERLLEQEGRFAHTAGK